MFPVMGTIRPNETGGWYVLDDGVHEPLGGLTVLSVDSTFIVVGFDTATKIHTFTVTPDEKLGGELHYACGGSAAINFAKIRMSDDNGPVNPQQVSNQFANLWINGWFT